MIRRFLFFALPATLLLVMYACDSGLQGNFNENQPPRTFLSINEINLDEDSEQGGRLVSQVHISWWGDDPDGYVTGYEYTTTDEDWIYTPETEDEVDWYYTERTDSVFVLPIPFGEQVADVRFTIRAIDNDDLRDPEGASVVFPIENSPPEISLHRTSTPQSPKEVPPDTTYHVASFGWTATDPDGDANLSHYEFVINDTLSEWTEVDPEVSFITMVIEDPADNQTSASLYLGRSMIPSDLVLEHIRMNDENTLYLRAFDNAGAESPLETFTWYVKEQTSRILFINDYPGTQGEAALNYHRQLLHDIGITQVDYLHVTDGQAVGGQKVPVSSGFHQPIESSLNRVLAEWDHIYWISNNLDRNITYALRATIDFFDNGGTMFINIPTKRLQEEDAIFDFLPYARNESVPPDMNSFRFTGNARLFPNQTISADTLQLSSGSESIYPMLPEGNTEQYFNGEFQTRPFNDPDQDYSRLIVSGNPQKTLIHFGYDLDRIVYGEEVREAVRFLLMDELEFAQ